MIVIDEEYASGNVAVDRMLNDQADYQESITDHSNASDCRIRPCESPMELELRELERKMKLIRERSGKLLDKGVRDKITGAHPLIKWLEKVDTTGTVKDQLDRLGDQGGDIIEFIGPKSLEEIQRLKEQDIRQRYE